MIKKSRLVCAFQRETVKAESGFTCAYSRSSLLSSGAELLVGTDGEPRYRLRECLLFERKNGWYRVAVLLRPVIGRSLFFYME